MNESLDPDLCFVSYTSFDAVVRWVRVYGRGALLAKTDIESAFCLLPLHSDSFRLLGCNWQECHFVNQCLPTGCSILCSFFETFSSFFEWVVREVSGLMSVIHYLDDFLCIGLAASNQCRVLLATVQHMLERFGIPLAAAKTEGSACKTLWPWNAASRKNKLMDLRAAVVSVRELASLLCVDFSRF